MSASPRISSIEEHSEDPFDRPRMLWWALIGLIFVIGLAVRLYRLADPPLDFHPTRQIHSALIARGMYYERQPDAPEWQREMAVSHWRMEGLIEPQVFERLSAWTYQWTGGPDLRVPRVYALLFWMVGAVFLAMLVVEVAGPGGALLAALFFLIWPYGVIASRVFQPEPLMIALLIMALWAALRWERSAAWQWAVSAGLLAGLAIYIKSVAVFLLGPALLALVICSRGLRPALRDRQVWAMALLALLPYAAYHIYGVYLRGYLVDQFSLRFFPQMWLDPAFYLRWIGNLGRAVPFELVLVSALGALLARRPVERAVLLAMWAGDFLYGMTLPHHISTHDYYHLPLYPLVALGLAAVAQVVFRSLPGPLWLSRAAAAAVVLAALLITGYNARNTLKRSSVAAQAQAYQEIGELLGPGASVAALVPDYGASLKYYAWISPANWLTADEIRWREELGQPFDFETQFAEQAAGKSFFVITQMDELERQPQLKEKLFEQYPIYRQTQDYLIFNLRSPLQPETGSP